MRATTLFIALCCGASPIGVHAEKLGDHPAVVVQRLQAQQTYDYASKFYPHPAWLYLYSEAPRSMMHHPAVIVAKREAEAKAASACAVPTEAQVAAR
jgi:hypothetical protein